MTAGSYSKFVFARPGDKSWSVIEGVRFVNDFINFNGQLYGIGWNGGLMLCDFSDPHPTFIDFANPPEDVKGYEPIYVVELGGELYMVIRLVDPTPIEFPPIEFHHVYKAVFFDVYKFDFSTRRWEYLKTLGDYAIFIGSNTTFGVKASDYPSCKPDSIYFTDDFKEPFGHLTGADMGIYNIEAGTIEPLYEGDDFLSRFSPPVWITPNPF
ncbi:hypothetical protein FRX31_005621 [Thalictrum thalictroides]|uniref:KIB1-4 beta-propeller domain-containing protein n=1 Tax=Thalictrum thalictroides TaxID=46969 RepID=A0A7J6X5X9_THATH|nr:hypothetical protein FRX31_005621 [Thalictrum thalictroides]